MNSDQGARQIRALPSVKLFCEQFNSLVEKRTLQLLRREIFAYTLISPESHVSSQRDYEIDVESPRVKNMQVKNYFCLAYFTVLYVQLWDEIEARKAKLEDQINQMHSCVSQRMSEHIMSQQSIMVDQKDRSPTFTSSEEHTTIDIMMAPHIMHD